MVAVDPLLREVLGYQFWGVANTHLSEHRLHLAIDIAREAAYISVLERGKLVKAAIPQNGDLRLPVRIVLRCPPGCILQRSFLEGLDLHLLRLRAREDGALAATAFAFEDPVHVRHALRAPGREVAFQRISDEKGELPALFPIHRGPTDAQRLGHRALSIGLVSVIRLGRLTIQGVEELYEVAGRYLGNEAERELLVFGDDAVVPLPSGRRFQVQCRTQLLQRLSSTSCEGGFRDGVDINAVEGHDGV
mmetsp:Transcript_26399/g.58064  ORF Transcript_26399/g.58064 Transcript_26399/m.58064 type:complete len:248 (-) Transcript_26399:311-1054(-)